MTRSYFSKLWLVRVMGPAARVEGHAARNIFSSLLHFVYERLSKGVGRRGEREREREREK